MMMGSNIAEAFNISVTISVLLLLFPYFWSGIALLKKGVKEQKVTAGNLAIVFLSSVFILSAFASANFDELLIVIAAALVIPGVYAVLMNVDIVHADSKS